ncbi:MAG: lipase [Muribaculaceae bacterium]|nr:lipase [Muribaculaceae bacterium]
MNNRFKAIITIFFSLFSSLLPFSLLGQKNDWANFARYADDNKALQENGSEPVNAIFFGNSITDSWASMRPGFFSANGFVGRGISGQTTYQFLSRFREDAINLRPRIIVLNGGTNDIAENSHPYSEEKTIGNIRSMVEIARANGIGVILTSVLPAAGFKWNRNVTDAPEKIESLNRHIIALADEFNIPYVDYHASLLAPDKRSFRADLSNDGVHPNAKGYEIMESLILPAIGNYGNAQQ